MTFLMIHSMILFLCCAIFAQCKAEEELSPDCPNRRDATDLKINFWDFSTLINGYYDNIEQESEDTLHDIIQFRMRPVLIPALQRDPAVYFEEAMNGYVYRRDILVRSERSTDTILFVTYYNFTDPKQYKLGEFNIDDVANFTLEDFGLDGGCQDTFTQILPGVVYGVATDCKHTVNGRHPVYSTYFSCNNIHFEPPLAGGETASLLPYDLKRKGPRYPLINPPEGYVNPCQDGL